MGMELEVDGIGMNKIFYIIPNNESAYVVIMDDTFAADFRRAIEGCVNVAVLETLGNNFSGESLVGCHH